MEGATGAETYVWTSSLGAVTGQPNMRSRSTVRSIDSGTHTCMATRGGLSGSDTIEMNVVGECLHVCIMIRNTGRITNSITCFCYFRVFVWV